ncbi:MAG: hypothetical protein ACRDZ4_00225 [Egibacteraceae bacterium]
MILRSRDMYARDYLVQIYDGYCYPLDLIEGREGTEPASSARLDGGLYAAFDWIGHHPRRATEEVG